MPRSEHYNKQKCSNINHFLRKNFFFIFFRTRKCMVLLGHPSYFFEIYWLNPVLGKIEKNPRKINKDEIRKCLSASFGDNLEIPNSNKIKLLKGFNQTKKIFFNKTPLYFK